MSAWFWVEPKIQNQNTDSRLYMTTNMFVHDTKCSLKITVHCLYYISPFTHLLIQKQYSSFKDTNHTYFQQTRLYVF